MDNSVMTELTGSIYEHSIGQHQNAKLQAQATVLTALIAKTDMDAVTRMNKANQMNTYRSMCIMAVSLVDGLGEAEKEIEEMNRLVKEN